MLENIIYVLWCCASGAVVGNVTARRNGNIYINIAALVVVNILILLAIKRANPCVQLTGGYGGSFWTGY